MTRRTLLRAAAQVASILIIAALIAGLIGLVFVMPESLRDAFVLIFIILFLGVGAPFALMRLFQFAWGKQHV